MQKLKQYAWVAAIAFGLLTAYWWHAADVADAELAALRAKNEQRFAEMRSELDALRAENDSWQRQIDALVEQNQQLVALNARLAGQVSRVREERDRRVREIPDLPVEALAVKTLEQLDLKPPEIRTTADKLIVFTPEAGRVNLEQLILGEAAAKELAISNQRILNLEEQVRNDGEIIAGKDALIANLRQELVLEQERSGLREEEHRKEIAAVKAKARKRNAIVGVLGFVGGLLVAVVAGG